MYFLICWDSRQFRINVSICDSWCLWWLLLGGYPLHNCHSVRGGTARQLLGCLWQYAAEQHLSDSHQGAASNIGRPFCQQNYWRSPARCKQAMCLKLDLKSKTWTACCWPCRCTCRALCECQWKKNLYWHCLTPAMDVIPAHTPNKCLIFTRMSFSTNTANTIRLQTLAKSKVYHWTAINFCLYPWCWQWPLFILLVEVLVGRTGSVLCLQISSHTRSCLVLTTHGSDAFAVLVCFVWLSHRLLVTTHESSCSWSTAVWQRGLSYVDLELAG